MKAGIVLSALVMLATAPAHAFDLSIVGMGLVSQGTISSTARTTKSDGLLSYGAGLLGEQRIDARGAFGLESGLLYVSRVNGYGADYRETTRWVQLPVLGRLHLGPLSLGAGGYVARGVGQVEARVLGQDVRVKYSESSIWGTDYGALLALGGTLPLSQSLGVCAEGRYSMALRNLSKADGVSLKYNDFQALLGLRFGI